MGNAAAGTAKRAAAVAVACAAMAVLAPPTAGAIPARPCGPVALEPIAPILQAAPGELLIEEVAPEAPANATATVDMDGDGIDDGLTGPAAGTVTVTRADGVLTLTDVPPSPPSPDYPGPFGDRIVGDDLDGDGRDELVITRWFVPGFRQPYRYETLIVRGTTPPGTVAVADVALSLRGDLVADVDGDGLDDLWLQGDLLLGSLLLPTTWASAKDALAGTDPTAVSPAADRYASFADLDLDGSADRVTLGSPDATTGPAVSLSSGQSFAIDVDGAPYGVRASRADVRTRLSFWTLEQPTSAASFELHVACADPWMRDATALVLGRPPIAADYPTFGPDDEPDLAARRQRAADLVRSQTGRGHLVDDSFQWFLGRGADPVGRAWWVRQLRSGARSPERMMTELLGSAERWRKAGSTAAGWVDAAYPTIYGRSPDPSGRAYWIRQVERLGTARTAARMFAEPAADRFLVRRYATDPHALGADGPLAPQAALVGELQERGFDRMLAELVAHPEHYLAANRRALLIT
jgi:hypothetical protein